MLAPRMTGADPILRKSLYVLLKNKCWWERDNDQEYKLFPHKQCIYLKSPGEYFKKYKYLRPITIKAGGKLKKYKISRTKLILWNLLHNHGILPIPLIRNLILCEKWTYLLKDENPSNIYVFTTYTNTLFWCTHTC